MDGWDVFDRPRWPKGMFIKWSDTCIDEAFSCIDMRDYLDERSEEKQGRYQYLQYPASYTYFNLQTCRVSWLWEKQRDDNDSCLWCCYLDDCCIIVKRAKQSEAGVFGSQRRSRLDKYLLSFHLPCIFHYWQKDWLFHSHRFKLIDGSRKNLLEQLVQLCLQMKAWEDISD